MWEVSEQFNLFFRMYRMRLKVTGLTSMWTWTMMMKRTRIKGRSRTFTPPSQVIGASIE